MFTVLGKAEPAGSKRGFFVGGKVRIVDANKNAAPYKDSVRWAAVEAMGARPLMLGPVRLEVTFHLLRPKSHFRKNGTLSPRALSAHIIKPDALKLTRGLEDALSGTIWRDDCQVVEQAVRKVYCCERPRSEVRVTELGPQA